MALEFYQSLSLANLRRVRLQQTLGFPKWLNRVSMFLFLWVPGSLTSPITDKSSLEIQFRLQHLVVGLGIGTRMSAVHRIVPAHDMCYASTNSLSK